MYFKYGSYKHADNEVDLTMITSVRMRSPRNRLVFTRWTLTCMGHFCESGQSAIKTKIEALRNAYIDDNKTAGLYHDDGTPSGHMLKNNTSIGGVKVVTLDWPRGGAGEYATGRTYRVVLQADYLNAEDQTYSFRETVQIMGTSDGDWDMILTPYGRPIPAQNHRYLPATIIQSGEIIGVQGWPILPAPMGNMMEHRDRRLVIHKSPKSMNRRLNMFYTTSYRYVFSTIGPVNAYPAQDYPPWR